MSNQYNTEIDQKLVNEFQDVIVEIFQVLRTFGIQELHVGGLMRMLGVDPEVACLYDNQVMMVDELEDYSDFNFDETPESFTVSNPGNKLH